ncbi:type VI secretion system baseplate subunit TssG [Silvibacterium sp.]|uniref:type VI secretion system baseplate subunit TssG n=1 Tax=Silvibacterium sp. TaxID=1964179 RepID=UPI0039E51F86
MTPLEGAGLLAAEEAPQLDARWGARSSAKDRLFADASGFDFYQAVKILEVLHRISGDGRSHREPVRFRSRMALEFPGSDIERVTVGAHEYAVPEMLVNFMGLAGAHAPLPAAYTAQLLRDRPNTKPSALRDFLDIFNHRLIALLYAIHRMHHPELIAGSPDEGLGANHLYAVMGLGRDPGSASRHRLRMPDRALLFYAGIFAHRPHSASGLATILRDYFQVEVAIEEFAGEWLPLAEDQWTRIGADQGRNQMLGDGAILGRRVWDEHAGIHIRLGPLGLKRFESFLPHGEAHSALYDLTRFYLGDEIDFRFILQLRQDEIPHASALGNEGPGVRRASLGRLSWLRPQDDVVPVHEQGAAGER